VLAGEVPGPGVDTADDIRAVLEWLAARGVAGG
jgi:hypothetical protein